MHYSLIPHHLIISAARAPHLAYKRTSLSQLDDDLLLEKLKSYDGIKQDTLSNTDLVTLSLPIIRSDLRLLENYHYHKSEPFSCNFIAFSGADDQTVSQEDISAWSTYTRGEFHHLSFAGKHFFLNNNKKIILHILNKVGESVSKEKNFDVSNSSFIDLDSSDYKLIKN
jgi:medium-chain acyl-[acyl-carrier-protein] hydrolase